MGRQWEWRAAYSWKAAFFFMDGRFSFFDFSVPLSLSVSVSPSSLFTSTPPPHFLLFLFSFSSPPLQSLWNCKATRWGLFFWQRKFGSDQNHQWAFLHSFPDLNDFFLIYYLQLHRHTHPDSQTYSHCKSLPPSLSLSLSVTLPLVHTAHFFHFALFSPLSRTYKHAHTKKKKTQFRPKKWWRHWRGANEQEPA